MHVCTLAIPGHPEHVKAARAFAGLVLGVHSRADDGTACLLVSELVTNSIRHAPGRRGDCGERDARGQRNAVGQPSGIITVTITILPGETLIEVTDDGGPNDPALHAPGTGAAVLAAAENGRGLLLVDELSASWGYFRHDGRLTTWFTLTTTEEPSMPPRSATSPPVRAHDHQPPASASCACGYQADSPVGLADHLAEVFSTADDIAPDGRLHAERRAVPPPAAACLCGFTATTNPELDAHLLRAFTPADAVAPDGTKHAAVPA